MTDAWITINKAMWDERVPIHVASEFYDVEGFLAGDTTLRQFEVEELGDVDGLTLVHPQCHFGLDSLSWARRGARVTGLDFSDPAIKAARELASRAGLQAEFVHANVYDAAAALAGRRFDVVYTGLGAINWLPDIERWAKTMAQLVARGGRFYLAEFHPFTKVFADEDLTLEHSYFERGAMHYDEPGTYADLDAQTTQNRSVEWEHTLGDVVSAIAGAGLRIELLHEHDYTLFARWSCLERKPDGTHRVPSGTPSLPLMYSVRARSPN
ncbi:MAG TPA: class I SAM-dependent methyltransferase [Solirubrobacteraceae bacterium]